MKVWLQACRVNSLAISSICVFVGTAVAVRAGHFDLFRFLLAWLGSVTIQAGTNMINAYNNYKATSADYDPHGSSAVMRLGLLTPAQVRRGAVVAFGVGVACGLLLTWMCGWIILALGLPSVAAGYFYGAKPIRLGYRGLGVITAFIFIGPVMICGAYFVQALSFSWSSLAAAIPIGLLTAGVLYTNDIRDLDTDVLHGKKTLATLTGRRAASYTLAGMDIVAFGVTIAAVPAQLLPWPVLLVLIAVPQAVAQLRMVFREKDAEKLHDAWLRGIKLHGQFGVLMIVGLLVSAALHY
jgi:1,4-dihydroxy-2-naphthoate octaprenyltransferase